MKCVRRLQEENLDFSELSGEALPGLVAVGGDLRPERLLHAYQRGIFPWYSEKDPLLWWSPQPRAVLFPAKVRISGSLRRLLRKQAHSFSLDRDFASVIENCAALPRPHQHGTWIHPEMERAYIHLHQLGFAHSLEVYRGKRLVGGLYGVSLGRAFFGESMFNLEPDTARLALAELARFLQHREFIIIDCQMMTPLTEQMGAELLDREDFTRLLIEAMAFPTLRGRWCFDEQHQG
jgi:leucyl/phenylalanyl-tRNA--protein transferase